MATINGDNNNNSLNGTLLSDQIYGLGGDDTLNGLDGNDSIYGGNGNDTLRGGTGNDFLIGSFGADTFIFSKGDGSDTISNYDGNLEDVVQLTDIASTEIMVQRLNYYDLVLTYGNNTSLTLDHYFYSSFLRDVKEFQLSDGVIWRWEEIRDKVLQGTNSDDVLIGYEDKQHTLSGLAGNDTLVGANLADTLNGDTGDDSLYGGDGSDTLRGGAGNDYLIGESGADTYIIAKSEGSDTIAGYDSGLNIEDIVQLIDIASTEITDIRRTNYENLDLVLAYGTNTSLTLDWYFYDSIYRVKELQFSDGVIWRWEDIRDKALQGTPSDDVLIGYDGKQHTLSGLAGNDVLYGANLGDTLNGGTGDDSLYGGDGANVYLIDKDDGNDIIFDTNTVNAIDVVKLIDVASTEVTQVKLGEFYNFDSNYNSDLRIAYGTSSSLVLWNYFGATPSHFTELQFSDGVTWRWTDIESKVLKGTNGNDYLVGYANKAHNLSGLAGDDILYGANLNDTLTGGVGNDFLNGGVGNDTYIFSRNDGKDEISDISGKDIIKFTDVASTDSIQVSIVNLGDFKDDLQVKYGDNSQFVIRDFLVSTQNRIEKITFSDGHSWGINAILAKSQQGTAGDDWLHLYSGNQLFGLGGNDVLWGNATNDILNGGSGNDELYAGLGNDTLIGGAGDDQLYGESLSYTEISQDTYLIAKNQGKDTIYSLKGNDLVKFTDIASTDVSKVSRGVDTNGAALVLSYGSGDQLTVGDYFSLPTGQFLFSDGITWTFQDIKPKALEGTAGDDNLIGYKNETNNLVGLAGNDTLLGQNGNDTLNGGVGDDYISDASGDDLYLFAANDGKDFVSDGGGNDIVQFTNVASTDITRVFRLPDGSNSVVLSYGLSNQLTLGGYFDAATSIETLRFSDGIVWALPDLQLTTSQATDGDDALYGGTGNDTLNGGLGNDYLQGNTGADTYLISQKGGQDVIYDNGNYLDTDIDVVKFTDVASTNINNISFSYINGTSYSTGTDLWLSYGINDRLTVKNYFDTFYQGPRVDQFQFSDGVIWQFADIQAKALLINDLDNVIIGQTNQTNTLAGLGGNDHIYGKNRADVLIGGKGNDFLYGDDLGDVYQFTKGDGQDIISDGGSRGIDTVLFTDLVSTEINNIARTNDDLLINYGNADQLTMRYYFLTNTAYKIDALTFTDKTIKNILVGTDGSDTLLGSGLNDILVGLGGADTLTGSAGDDIYWVDNTGDNVIEGVNLGIDTVLSTVDFTLTNQVENLVLKPGAQKATGNVFDNVLTGNTANNTLSALAGNDNLNGKSGNDTLTGGLGADNFVFDSSLNAINNNDTITDFSSLNDTLQLDNAIFSKFSTPGALLGDNFVSGAGATALDANDYLIYDTNDGSLFYDANGNAAGGKVEFLSLVGIPQLTLADMVII